MDGNLVTANRATHLKVAPVAVLAAAAVIWIASCAQINGLAKDGLAMKVQAPAFHPQRDDASVL